MKTVAAFESAMAVASRPESRTAVMIAKKDTARNAAEQFCRHYYALIKLNAGVSDASKLEIGVRPINSARVKIGCPQTSPILGIVAATPGTHTLVYRDSMTPDSRAKPYGAAALQLMVAVADRPVRGRDVRLPGAQGSAAPGSAAPGTAGTRKGKRKPPDAAPPPPPPPPPEVEGGGDASREVALRSVGQFTTNPITVTFDQADDGRKATYFGRWVSRRGEVGPWSLPITMTIVA